MFLDEGESEEPSGFPDNEAIDERLKEDEEFIEESDPEDTLEEKAEEFPDDFAVEEAEPYDEEFFSESEAGIIAGEDRIRVKKTDGVPWRWICKVSILKRGREYEGGSGVLISNRHVLTSAHVVYPAYIDPYNYSIKITPALNWGDKPFGEYTVSAKPKIPKKYDPKAKSDFDQDYALITLKKSVGEKEFSRNPLCYWGNPRCGQNTIFTNLAAKTLIGTPVLTAGYPISKGGLQLWCAAGILYGAYWRLRTMSITADMTKGQSGSPVWLRENNRYYLVGIAAGAGEDVNLVVRVTREFINQIRDWIFADGDTPTMLVRKKTFQLEVALDGGSEEEGDLFDPEADESHDVDAEVNDEAFDQEFEEADSYEEDLFVDYANREDSESDEILDGLAGEETIEEEEDPITEDVAEKNEGTEIEDYHEFLAAPPKLRLSHFICNDADLSEVIRVLGKRVTIDALESALKSVLEDAVSWLSFAAGALRKSRPNHAISFAGTTWQFFHEAFGTFPSVIPSWRPAGKTWDRGDVVRTRLKRAAEILAGGSIKFYCWGPHSRPGLAWKPTLFYKYAAQKKAVYIGPAFWKAWKSDDNLSMGSTLLMSALAINYNKIKNSSTGGRYRNAHCYARFVQRVNNLLNLPDWVKKSCSPAPVSRRKVRNLLRAIVKAIRLMIQANKHIKIQAQRELLSEIIEELSWFFIKGRHYGIKDEWGKIKSRSRARRSQFFIKGRRPKHMPLALQHRSYLYMSHEVALPEGDHKSDPKHSVIGLYIRRLIDRSPADVATVLIHEMLHMMCSRFRDIEGKFGREVARGIPTRTAGVLLDVHAFSPHRRVMKKHFSILADFLKLQPDIASVWADRTAGRVVEEVLSHLFHGRMMIAIDNIGAGKTGSVVQFEFVPMKFLEDYLSRHWLQSTEQRAAVRTPKAQQILSNMENDLNKLVNDIGKHLNR